MFRRRKAKAMGPSMRFRNQSETFAIGPEELKSVEVVGGGKTAAAAAAAAGAGGVSTSTPSLGPRSTPRSYTMESSKSGTSAATSDDFDYLESTDKGQLLPSTKF